MANSQKFTGLTISENDFAEMATEKLVVCIVVDSSFSMNQSSDIKHHKSNIEQVNKGIHSLIDSAKKNIYAADMLDIEIITYGGTANVYSPFCIVKNMKFKDIIANGKTDMAPALKLALSTIKARQEHWNKVGTGGYKPWLIVIGDGNATTDISESAKEVRQLIKDKKIKYKFIGVGNGDFKSLKLLSPAGKVSSMTGLEITDFFNNLSTAVANTSLSTPEAESEEQELGKK